MLVTTLLGEISSHNLEVAETLIAVIRFMLIFLAARTLAEVLVRFVDQEEASRLRAVPLDGGCLR